MWISDPELSVEGAGIAAAPAPASRRRSRAGVALGWVGERLRTTPGRLVLTSVLVVIGAVVFGIVATGAEQSRERAVRAARTATEPQLVQAVHLYTALSDANATVATGLLRGGLEPTSSRIRYANDINVATSALTALTRGAGTPGAQADLGTIADQLPTYTGYIEAARANSRQGFPIGAAYLRQADALLKSSMLPAADRVYAAEAERLNNDYQTGTDTATLVVLVAAISLALALLLLAQLYVTRISHRVFNVAMVIATVALAVVSVWALVGVTNEQNSLVSAQRDGSDSLEALSAADVLLSRAQRDLSLTLVNRGTDQVDPLDFTAVTRVLITSPIAAPLRSRFVSYRAAADRIQQLELGGQLEAAIHQLPPVATMSEQLSGELGRQITAADARFSHSAGDAASDLSGLGLAIPLVTVLVAVLSLLGLRQRINEYR
jgi:hypothetical protein